MNTFEKLFEKLAKTDDASTIWINWLDWVIDQNLLINHDRNLDFKGNEQTYFELYCAWIDIVKKRLEQSDLFYYDYLGEFYEDVIQSKYKAGTNGQFFTPQCVSKLMAKTCLLDGGNGGTINDCACGSGRLLLDCYAENPNAILIGQDLDPVACKMAVLNFYITGARGSVIHMNTLTLESFQAWRVNNYLYHGLPLPHIELVNEREAYSFVGVSNIKKPVKVDELDKEPLTINDKPVMSYKPKGTGQTTLF